MSKRARRCCSSGEIISCMKQDASDGDHQQENNDGEEKTTSISAASTINFHSRKIRNVFIPDKEKTQLSQEIFLKSTVAVCTALPAEDAEEILLKSPVEGCKTLSTEDAEETILKSFGAGCTALPAEDAGEISLMSPIAGCTPLSIKDLEEIILKSTIAGCKALSTEDAVAMAIEHLKQSDLKLCCVIEMYDKPKFQKCQGAFQALVQSIVYQQLAIKSAAMIHGRLISLCGGNIGVIPDNVSKISVSEMRKIGISARKASYIHDLASNFLSGVLSDSSIYEMDDDSLISSLTAVKGIGVWSVHMFMIFSLHRPDVLPVGDLGVRKGVQKLYELKDLPAPAEMEFLCNSWRPYRSIGSWYMWRFIGTKGPIFTSE